MKNPSILVIDDEPDNFDVIETFLNGQDYVLHYASSGQEALAAFDAFNPDLILLDVMMPEIDGIEVCRQIKSTLKRQAVPIIMVTALNAKEDLARCLQAGADDFISKPVNAVELRARVHSMLRIKQQYDRIQSLSKLQKTTISLLKDNLNGLRGNLVVSLPHELNTPLNGILGAIGLLIEDIDSMDSESIHELLDISYQSACRLENLTQRFLTYLCLELATTSLKQEVDDFKITNDVSSSSSLIEHLAKMIAEQMNRSDDLVCQITESDLAVSPEHLKWLIQELIDNAFKFSQSETPVTISSQNQDGMFHLWINDQGRGMTNEQISTIGAFMQFERQTYEQQGVGLGLKIAQKVVDLYGGQWAISSRYQRETTVHLALPLTISQPQLNRPSQQDFETLVIQYNTDT
jgi:CheY-like chemotaxis protein